jgi:hypothetical protein
MERGVKGGASRRIRYLNPHGRKKVTFSLPSEKLFVFLQTFVKIH